MLKKITLHLDRRGEGFIGKDSDGKIYFLPKNFNNKEHHLFDVLLVKEKGIIEKERFSIIPNKKEIVRNDQLTIGWSEYENYSGRVVGLGRFYEGVLIDITRPRGEEIRNLSPDSLEFTSSLSYYFRHDEESSLNGAYKMLLSLWEENHKDSYYGLHFPFDYNEMEDVILASKKEAEMKLLEDFLYSKLREVLYYNSNPKLLAEELKSLAKSLDAELSVKRIPYRTTVSDVILSKGDVEANASVDIIKHLYLENGEFKIAGEEVDPRCLFFAMEKIKDLNKEMFNVLKEKMDETVLSIANAIENIKMKIEGVVHYNYSVNKEISNSAQTVYNIEILNYFDDGTSISFEERVVHDDTLGRTFGLNQGPEDFVKKKIFNRFSDEKESVSWMLHNSGLPSDARIYLDNLRSECFKIKIDEINLEKI